MTFSSILHRFPAAVCHVFFLNFVFTTKVANKIKIKYSVKKMTIFTTIFCLQIRKNNKQEFFSKKFFQKKFRFF
jgi:hypothetical protein